MNNKPMKFDSNGIWASSPELTKIGLQVLEQEKRERELRGSGSQSGKQPAPVDSSEPGTSATATDPFIPYNLNTGTAAPKDSETLPFKP